MRSLMARMEREPDTPDIGALYRVIVTDFMEFQHRSVSSIVVEKESYAVASQLTDALNYRFGIRGALGVLGMGVRGEIAEMADNVAARFKEKGDRA